MVDSLLRHRRALITALALTMAVLLVVALAPGASAGYAWNDMKGPGDGDARALLYDSAHSILYRGTANRGVWKYQAGVWMDTGGGLTGHTVLSLAYDSANNVLYAGTAGQGVWRCANPGTAPAWTATGGDTGAMHVNALLFIGTGLYAGTSGQGVWRCANPRAATPAWAYTGGPEITMGTPLRDYRLTVGSLASDGTRLYAGTNDHGVFRTSNPGDASPGWSDISGGTVNGYTVNALAHDGTRLYAGVAGFGVWRSSNPGSSPASVTWSDIWGAKFTVNAMLYQEGHLYAGTTAGVRRSDNPSGLSPGWGLAGSGVERYRVLSLAYASAGTTLYAGTDGHGVARCTSPATSPNWSGTGTTISGYTVYSVAYDTSRNLIYAGTNGHGVWRCSNPDTSPAWTSLGGSVSGYSFRALAYDSARNILYGATEYGHGLYRCSSPNTSPSWTGLGGVEGPQGGPVDLYALAYDGEVNILYVGTATTGVYRVENPHGSHSWGRVCGTFLGIEILESMSGYTAYSLALDGHGSSKYLYATTGGEGVWRHTHPEWSLFNPGWERMSTMLFQTYHSLHYDTTNEVLYAGGVGAIRCDNPRTADPSATSWTRILSIASGQVVHSIARDPATDTLFAGIAGGGVWRCANPRTSPAWTDTWGHNKTTFTVMLQNSKLYAGGFEHGVDRCDSRDAVVPAFSATGGGVSKNTVSAQAYDAANDVLFAAAEGYQGVWRCDNPGTSPAWTSLGGDVAGYTVKSLAYDGTHLYAGTWGQGAWRCDNPLTSPSWTNISGPNLYGVDAADASNIWAVGEGGTILHYDGSSWSRQASGTTQNLYGVNALSASSVWAVGEGGTILHFNGSAWSAQASGTTQRLLGVDALNASNIWAVGDFGEITKEGLILRYNGSSWSAQTAPPNCGDLHSVAAVATNDVWVVGHEGVAPALQTEGRSSILHYDGSSWSAVLGETVAYLRGVSAINGSNIWSVGGALEVGLTPGPDVEPIIKSSIFRYNGSSWVNQKDIVPAGTSDLYGVSARTTSDVWAVGDKGNILHFNGSAWSLEESGTERRLNGVKPLASDNVWAVGDKGAILHYDGSAWSRVSDGVAGFTLESLAYDSGDNILYGGGSGKGVWRCTEPDVNPSWYDISGAVGGFTMNGLVATGGRVYGAASFKGVWRCEFPLAEVPTWTDIGDSAWKNDTVYSLATDGTRLYAGGQGVWRCDNPTAGASWTDTGGRVSDKIVRSLAYDIADNVLFAGTQGQGVWRGIQPDTSPVWLNAAGGLSEQVVRSLACDSSNDILFAGTEGRGVRSAGAGPVPTVLTGSPAKGYKGTTLNVALTGAETSFANGVSAATFGSGITVNSTTVTDATHAMANITISNDAVAGERDVNVMTGAESPEALAEGFKVIRPRIASVSPASQGQGQTLDILIWGEDTHFVHGSSRAAVSGEGVTVNSTTVTSPTEAKANITISQTAEPGTRQVNVVTGAETPDALTGLKVLTAKPQVDLIYPKSGPVGTEVTIMGKNFGTSRGSSKVTFNGKAASGYNYWSGNLVKCAVPEGAVTGLVKVVTPGGTSNGKNFTVTQHEGPVGLTWTWYLAEGSTDWGFDTYITLTNPNASGVTADVTYMTSEGPKEHAGLWLPPLSQTTLSPRADIGEADFSTRVVCTTEYEPIAVDRTMLWTGPGAPSAEGHSSIGVTAPATEWYLPEGSSAWGFETWLLIQNPGDTDAACTLTYMIEGEGPVVVAKNVPANSRASFNMADDIGSKDASIKVQSPVPVIPERSMYRNARREGHVSIGTTTPATDYYLAEGTTDWGYTSYVLVQNPSDAPAEVTVTYMAADGAKPQAPFVMEPNSRRTIRVNDVLPAADFSTLVHGSVPIIAERAMYWGAGTPAGEACHDSIGLAGPHGTFYLPDGETSNGRETYVLVQNPNPVDVTVRVTYFTPTGSNNPSFTDTVPANSRRTYNMADKLPSSRASAVVECETDGMKIMVERAMYWNARGAGTNTIGGFSD